MDIFSLIPSYIERNIFKFHFISYNKSFKLKRNFSPIFIDKSLTKIKYFEHFFDKDVFLVKCIKYHISYKFLTYIFYDFELPEDLKADCCFEIALLADNVDACKWFYNFGDVFDEDFCYREHCKTFSLEMFQCLYDMKVPWDSVHFSLIMSNMSIEHYEWLVSKRCPLKNIDYTSFGINISKEICIWMENNGFKTKDIFKYAVKHGSLELCQWIYDNRNHLIKKIDLDTISFNTVPEKCKWLYEKKLADDESIYYNSIQLGCFDLCKEFYNKGCFIDDIDTTIIFSTEFEDNCYLLKKLLCYSETQEEYDKNLNNFIEMYEWLLSIGYAWNGNNLWNAIITRSIKLCKRIYIENYPFNHLTKGVAYSNGCLEICQWVYEKSSDKHLYDYYFESAVSKGCFKMCKWLYSLGCPYNKYTIKKIANISGNRSIANWLVKKQLI